MELAPKILFFAVLLLDVWLLFIRPRKPWTDRLSPVLLLIAIYAFAIGALAQAKIIPDSQVLEGMTSADLPRFLRSNLLFLADLSSAWAVALDSVRTSDAGFYSFDMIAVLAFGFVGFVYAVLHLLVIMPFTYVAYALASVPVEAIRKSGADVSLRLGEQAAIVKAVTAANAVAIKSFLVALSAGALAATSKILSLCKRGARTATAADKTIQKPPAEFEF
jgi:hypothetical protein